MKIILFCVLTLANINVYASTLYFNGTFSNANDEAIFDISVNSIQNIALHTTSFKDGGFVPVVGLFNEAGIGQFSTTAFNVDPRIRLERYVEDGTAGFRLDPNRLYHMLTPGNYTAYLRAQGGTTPFGFDSNSPFWRLTIYGEDIDVTQVISDVPEPSSFWLAVLGLVGLLGARKSSITALLHS